MIAARDLEPDPLPLRTLAFGKLAATSSGERQEALETMRNQCSSDDFVSG